jgi:hypothetical protein
MKWFVRRGWFPVAMVLALAVAGCDNGAEPPKQAAPKPTQKPTLLPELDTGFSVVLEAEAGAVEPAMVVEVFTPHEHADLGLQEASGGRCVSVPKGANDAAKQAKLPLPGSVTLTFSVPKEGVYYIWPRCWWDDQCSNSFGMLLDGGSQVAGAKPILVTGTVYRAWRWIKFQALDPASGAPRGFRLIQGEHTITFTNREDQVKLDQVYITDDPYDVPSGIMTKGGL